MILLWHYYWPVIAAGLVIGFITGKLFHRRARAQRRYVLAAGAAIGLAFAGLWHGPLGAADRLSGRIERDARITLEHFEMGAVTARMERGPLRRRLVLSGPSDSVQQQLLARTMSEIPGVSEVRWANPPSAAVYMK